MKINGSKILGFVPYAPTLDTETLAMAGPRLILRLDWDCRQLVDNGDVGSASLHFAPRGVTFAAGWVIGLPATASLTKPTQ